MAESRPGKVPDGPQVDGGREATSKRWCARYWQRLGSNWDVRRPTSLGGRGRTQTVLSIGALEEHSLAMKKPYDTEVGAISKLLIKAILDKEGKRLLENPGSVDLDILNILREVGSTTTGGVVQELASRLAEQEKKSVD